MNNATTNPAEMLLVLNDIAQREIALKFAALGDELGCISNIRYAKAHKKWKCMFSKKNPRRVLYTIECDENTWRLKANLFNMNKYEAVVGKCSLNIINHLIASYDCRRCSTNCKGGAEFRLQGDTHVKCIGCCFYFADLTDVEWGEVYNLVSRENDI